MNSSYTDNNRTSKKGIVTIITFFALLIGLICDSLGNLDFINKFTSISYTEANELMKEYGNAYEHALKYKAEYIDAKNDSEKWNIKEEALQKFKNIVSKDVLDTIEYSIFDDTNEETGYMDVKEYDYNEFKYTQNIEVPSDKKEIIVKDSYIIKTSRKDPTQKKRINIEPQVFKYSRKYFFGHVIIEGCTSYKDWLINYKSIQIHKNY